MYRLIIWGMRDRANFSGGQSKTKDQSACDDAEADPEKSFLPFFRALVDPGIQCSSQQNLPPDNSIGNDLSQVIPLINGQCRFLFEKDHVY